VGQPVAEPENATGPAGAGEIYEVSRCYTKISPFLTVGNWHLF
jgi:hypothetical protein